MKNQISLFLITALAFLGVATMRDNGQKSFVLSSDQELKVSGTSSIHDWDMISKKAEGNATILVSGNKIIGVKSLEVNLSATSLKSGRNGMDDNAYKALNTSKYPQIKFELIDVISTTGSNAKVKGKLTIAGTSQIFTIDLAYKISDNAIRFTGSFPLTFKQFKLNPPTAIFGTIKTGNDLRISFDTQFKSSSK